MNIESFIEWLTSSKPLLLSIILFLSSIIEYIFPPFPGDSITLAGAILVGVYKYDFFLVFFSATAGSFLGSLFDFWIGRILRNKKELWILKFKSSEKFNKKLENALQRFKKLGWIAILINRFLPGIRAFLFVAAGASNMNFYLVGFLSLASITLWNLIIIFAGMMVGKNFSIIADAIQNYYILMWIFIIVLSVYFLTKFLLKRKKRNE